MSHLSKTTSDLLDQSKRLHLLNNKLHHQIDNLSGVIKPYDNPFESITEDISYIDHLEYIIKINDSLLNHLENNIQRLTHSTLKVKKIKNETV
jgi:hypothetical protein